MKRMFSLACGVVALCAASSHAAGLGQVYDASLGTLPEDQGFTHSNTPSPGPALSVESGLLRQDTRGYRQTPVGAGYQYFIAGHASENFADGLLMSLELQVIESSYDPDFVGIGGSDARSAGYGIGGIDNLGRIFSIGITETGVFIDNTLSGDESTGSSFFAFDTTDAIHTYDVAVSALGIDVKIDGNPAVSALLGPTGEFPINFGFLAFGDVFDDRASVPSESVTDLASFSYMIVPEPTSGLLLIGGLLVVARRRIAR